MSTNTKNTKKSKNGTRPKNHYFTEVHEDAIVEYALTSDIKIKTHLYVEYISPALSEMVDKIVYTYKFTTLSNIDDLKEECKIELTTILNKYDPNRGSKAFSYFSVITKNWFIHKVKKQSVKLRREVEFSELSKDFENEHASVENPYLNDREDKEFWVHLWEEIYQWDKMKLKANERKVLEAVKILLANPDDIEIFNKKAIYLYIREITGLNTKQVVNSLNKMRTRYRTFKTKWINGEL